MKYPMTVEYQPYNDDWLAGCNRYESLSDKDGKTIYSVCDLTECPEDATLFRSLTSAYDIIELIKFGMYLKYLGYDDIAITEKEVDW